MSAFLGLLKLRRVRLAAAEDSQEWTSSICWPWRHPTSAPKTADAHRHAACPCTHLLPVLPGKQACQSAVDMSSQPQAI